jgi:hypothetical protein
MMLTNSFQFLHQIATALHSIEGLMSNPYFSYTLGFNVGLDKINQCKLYIRFFERDDSFLKFFEIFTDPSIRQMATHDFHQAEDIAFKKSELGFKGFTIGLVKDFDTNRTGYGWGARATSIISGPIFMVIDFLMISFLKKHTNMLRLTGAFLASPL